MTDIKIENRSRQAHAHRALAYYAKFTTDDGYCELDADLATMATDLIGDLLHLITRQVSTRDGRIDTAQDAVNNAVGNFVDEIDGAKEYIR